MPFVPFLTARTLQAVAYVEIGKEFLSAYRTVSIDELRIGEPTIDGGDLPGILLPALLRTAELLEGLSILIQRDSSGARYYDHALSNTTDTAGGTESNTAAPTNAAAGHRVSILLVLHGVGIRSHHYFL